MGMLRACAHIPIQKLKSSKTDNSYILNNKKKRTRNQQQQISMFNWKGDNSNVMYF